MAADNPAETSASGIVALFDLHRAELLRFLQARCGDPAEAEDFLQDLWLRLATIQPGPIGHPRAYLFRIANNLVIDAVRSRQRAMARDRHWLAEDRTADGPPDEVRDPSPSAEDTLVEAEEVRLVAQAIERLPAGARRALQLHRFEQMSQGEVATVMGISRSGVEKHLALAMKRLREHLIDCGWFGSVSSRQDEGRREPRPARGGQEGRGNG